MLLLRITMLAASLLRLEAIDAEAPQNTSGLVRLLVERCWPESFSA